MGLRMLRIDAGITAAHWRLYLNILRASDYNRELETENHKGVGIDYFLLEHIFGYSRLLAGSGQSCGSVKGGAGRYYLDAAQQWPASSSR